LEVYGAEVKSRSSNLFPATELEGNKGVEESVAANINSQYGYLGVEATTWTSGNAVDIKAPNGKSTKIYVDNPAVAQKEIVNFIAANPKGDDILEQSKWAEGIRQSTKSSSAGSGDAIFTPQ
jgi:hypothetical protein